MISLRFATVMYVMSALCPVQDFMTNDRSLQYLAYALAIGTVVIHVLSIIMALWALLKPSGDLKSNAGEAATVLQDAEDKDTQYITNLTKPPTSS
jgi:hypothetical protein